MHGARIVKAGICSGYEFQAVQTDRSPPQSKTHTFGDQPHSKTHTF